MNKAKLAYYISTGLFTAMMCMSVGMYLFNNAQIQEVFTKLGYPTYIIYPLAAAKALGILVIWTRKSLFLMNLAYAGFFYNLILGFFAHVMINDGEFFGALLGMVLLVTSFKSQRKCSPKRRRGPPREPRLME